jgi:hypothetical protein
MERTLNTQQIGNSKDLRLEEKVARMCVVGAPGPRSIPK